MPVLKCSVCIDGQDNILGDGSAELWSPPDTSDGHRLLHVGVHRVGLLASEDIVNLDGAVRAALGNVLVFGVETDAEGLDVSVSERVLVTHLDL